VQKRGIRQNESRLEYNIHVWFYYFINRNTNFCWKRSNTYQQKFCLKIMEKLDYDSKGDYRQDLYDTIKSTLIINQTKYEEVKREWCFVSWDKEGNLYCNAELISYRGNKTK